MSGYGEDGIPLVLRPASSYSLGRPDPSSGNSDLNDPGSPTLRPYHGYVSHSAHESDEIDTSHVRLTSPALPMDVEVGELRSESHAGPPPSPSALFGGKSRSWQTTRDPQAMSPIARAASVGREIAGRIKSIGTGVNKGYSSTQPIQEGEEMEVGLVGAAYKFGSGGASYAAVHDDAEGDDGDATAYHGVDLSSFTGGPMISHDHETILHYRQLESNGQLTGGLGTGSKPDATISSKDLLAQSPQSPISPTRRLSRRQSRLNRAPTLRDLAQAEANKRGQIIQVIVEENSDGTPGASTNTTEPLNTPEAVADIEAGEPTAVDLTSYGGESTLKGEFDSAARNRQPTFGRPVDLARVETFYPVANWKPFSMQWPYLTSLIIISVVVSASQEYLYQRSNANSKLDPPQGLYTFRSAQEVTTWDYFTFKYLPTILAVTYGVLWQLADFEVKRLEPYYQLSKDGGALAAESINVDYITIFNFWRPILALRLRHWAVAISSLASLLAVSLVPTVQSASITLEPDLTARLQDPDRPKYIIILSLWSRTLSTILAIIAFLGCCLLYLLQRRHSGLVGDVKGIAGVAAMATKSHILMDFKDLDTVAPQEIHNKLKDHRYTLRNSSLAPDNDNSVSRKDKDKYDHFKLSRHPHPLMLRLIAGIPMISVMLVFLAFIPAVLFTDGASVVTDKAPWFLTAVSVIIKLAYQTVEQDLRMMEPFYKLSCRHASPKVLTLDYTRMAFGYLPFTAALNGDYLIALVGFGSVLAEVLTVCVTSFSGVTGDEFLPAPNNGTIPVDHSAQSGEETPISFWVSFTLAVGILLYLITTSALGYMMRRHAFLPRQPSTIASVLAFVHQSKMLYDFASKAKGEDNDGMVRRLLDAGKTYGLGWFTGRDGETHCGIDEEELQASYKHKASDDVRLATKPWLSNWETY